MEIPEGEEGQRGKEERFETMMTEKLPELMSDPHPQIQESPRTPSRVNASNTYT